MVPEKHKWPNAPQRGGYLRGSVISTQGGNRRVSARHGASRPIKTGVATARKATRSRRDKCKRPDPNTRNVSLVPEGESGRTKAIKHCTSKWPGPTQATGSDVVLGCAETYHGHLCCPLASLPGSMGTDERKPPRGRGLSFQHSLEECKRPGTT
ncbi:unnamed protein product [Ixodes pacificus]